MRVLTFVVALSLILPASLSPQPRSFKVATWNVRSGMGVRGFASPSGPEWSSTTLNCTDTAKTMNAWGMGLPQKELNRVKADTAIVALAVQEAWNCGSPTRLNGVLGFKTATREQEGVALIARHGFAGAPVYQQIDPRHNRWLIGGAVCLDAACSTSLPMFSTHFGGESDDDFPPQAAKVTELMKAQSEPRLFMGDLNLFRIDQWNPKVPCTSPDTAGRVAAITAIEQAGYTDVWKATQTGEGWTGMASRRGCGSPAGSPYKRIDYVFIRGLRPIGITRFGQVAPGTESPSDHAGLVAELGWPSHR